MVQDTSTGSAQENILKTDTIPEIVEPSLGDQSQIPNMENSKKLPIKKILFGMVGLLAFITILGVLFGKKDNGGGSVIVPSPSPNVNLSKYEEDTDSDKIPDFIEVKTGLDPNTSEVDACFENRCNVPSIQEVTAKPRNVMIVLDASGSMQEMVGGATKMESAKLAIREYLKKSATLPMTKVGLAVYGQEGSNQEKDKELSCSSSKVLVPLGELKQSNAEQTLSSIKPVGWTAIGLGLTTAHGSFVQDKEEDKEGTRSAAINEVVVISDGVETCDTDPVGKARELAGSEEKVTVHVIGFAVDDNESGELKKIAEAGGGTYATAPTIDELKLAMDLQWENYQRKTREAACSEQGAKLYYACIDRAIQLVRSWVSAELSRDPRQLSYEEKLKIDRLRWVVPAYMRGKLEDGGDFLPASESSN